MSYRIYQVGGSVRDALLGVESKDEDFVFCLDNVKDKTVDQGWEEMLEHLNKYGYQIFLETKDCFTVRARFPQDHKLAGTVADFVMARKEVGYKRGVDRKPEIVLGTLYDDLERRDFTVNAIAKDIDGKLIDFFDGQTHLRQKMLYTPLDPMETFQDDPLRVLRAIRFVITKGFELSYSVIQAMSNPRLADYFGVVSTERIREELQRCFKFSTRDTLIAMSYFKTINEALWEHIWSRDIWLKPTNEVR
jgi:poly(A) polymerase